MALFRVYQVPWKASFCGVWVLLGRSVWVGCVVHDTGGILVWGEVGLGITAGVAAAFICATGSWVGGKHCDLGSFDGWDC